MPTSALEPVTAVRTERDLLSVRRGVYTLEQLYGAVHADGATGRDDGDRVIHGVSDTRWKRRVRGALQTLKRQGRARRVGDSCWILEGTPDRPARALLVTLGGHHADIELRLAEAREVLTSLDEPVDLVCTDPPYGLGVGTGPRHDTGARVYGRDATAVVDGYVDVPAHAYRQFTTEWVAAAAAAIRPGGYLAAVTGPQQAAYVQVAAEDAGLEYMNVLAIGKVFPLRTTRKFAHAHWSAVLMCKGPVTSLRRVFTPPPDLPKARSGVDYPLDHWEIGSVGRADARPGQRRYPNSLPVTLVDRLVGALTRPVERGKAPDVVCDPFLGGGTTALVALRRGLRFIGSDVNPAAVAFTAARLSEDLRSSAQRELSLG